ncbi:metal ABC transporter permease [Lachnoclostridium phytofermentans]|uniref:ABC-3 protein n=1 Tax=Lachnoclostridium phytofermentans (strain ATCC 700394 / DSM 18823 / ISDg) TaxID=357809 RepID=A9KHG0_LACP7|nr:metal ABC transporter permease [Lachnoclostridium phytofermentans]ABX40827.1 ABC-3 protein [Lachnoclostridium phytofermentans ISDg]
MMEKLVYYFEFPFVRYALLVGVLISLCTSLLGVPLVLKRYSMIGDGLSHVAFGATAIAAIFHITTNVYITLPITVICAVLLIRNGENKRIKGDASIAMLSVGALAIGYLFLNIFSTSTNLSGDVCSTLFGSTSILTLSKTDVVLSMVLSVVVLLVFTIFYNKIFVITFDESFSKATGVKTGVYNLMLAIITAIVIVLAMNLVGALLISALIIFPATSSMKVFKSFRTVILSSAIIAVLCATLGILTSILLGTPVGSTIVAANIIVFVCIEIMTRSFKIIKG